MKCVREFFDPSFDLYAAGIAHPAFASADVELFRRQTLNEIREAHADPDEEVRRISELFAFRDHPYALRQSGTIETVSKFTPAQVADYFKRLAARSSMLVVAVGNIDRPHLEAALHRNFASLPEGEPRTAAPPPLVPRPTALTTEERDLPTAYVRGVIPAVSPTDPRFPAQYLTADILASRLFEEVRTRRNLSYAVWSGLAERRANNMTLYVTSTKPTEAVAVMRQTVRELAERPLTPDQLKGYVATLITNYYLGIETSEDQANQLGHEQIVAGDWRRTFTFVDAIREVTPAQVQAEARRMLEGGAQWAILGKVKGLDQGGFLGQPQK
jgi:predicted Zn-dependent peptidase